MLELIGVASPEIKELVTLFGSWAEAEGSGGYKI